MNNIYCCWLLLTVKLLAAAKSNGRGNFLYENYKAVDQQRYMPPLATTHPEAASFSALCQIPAAGSPTW